MKKSQSEAVKLYEEAAEAGHGKSMSMLGVIYLEGIGVALDERAGVDWLQKGVAAGDGSAMRQLAKCYEFGNSVLSSDLLKAQRLYEQAVAHGEYVGSKVETIREELKGR